MELTAFDYAQAAIAAVLVGFSKTGVPGLGILIVPILAGVLGARTANGVLLPMLLFADFFAVGYYRQHANRQLLLKLLPWVLGGIALGYVALDRLTSKDLNAFFAILILGLVGLQVARQALGGWLEEHLPKAWWFSAVMGALAGFTTMVGNLAGSITGLYLLSMRVDKHAFMGTSAWFYLTVNAIKLPLYFMLGLTTGATLLVDVKMVVFIVLGVFVGLAAFKSIPQEWFDRVVLALAALAAVRLFFV